MKIQKVSFANYNQELQQKKFNRTLVSGSMQHDSISFKDGGVSASLVLLVVKEGYKGLKNNSARATFKNEIAQGIACPDLSNNAKKLVDILFALSKTKGKDEPTNILYDLNDKYSSALTLKALRSSAVGKLFPLIPVMKNDKNSGNSAKMAMLTSMIETGEYLESPYIYHAFKSLFNNSDKESLILKALRDKNVWREINETYSKPKAEEWAENSYKYSEDTSDSDSFFHFLKCIFYDLPKELIRQKQHTNKEKNILLPIVQQEMEVKKSLVNMALINTLDANKHQEFFSSYGDIIKNQASMAYNKIAQMLKENYDGKPAKDQLYKKYANAFDDMTIPQEALSINYLKDFIAYYKNDKDALAKEFNINRDYCDDISKDFELITENSSALHLNSDTLRRYEKRINEKLSSNNQEIQNSAATLVYLSGHAKELKKLLNGKDEISKKLESILERDNVIYGCKKPYVPTIAEIKEAEEKARLERKSDSTFDESDIDLMEAHTRIMYM